MHADKKIKGVSSFSCWFPATPSSMPSLQPDPLCLWPLFLYGRICGPPSHFILIPALPKKQAPQGARSEDLGTSLMSCVHRVRSFMGQDGLACGHLPSFSLASSTHALVETSVCDGRPPEGLTSSVLRLSLLLELSWGPCPHSHDSWGPSWWDLC